MNDGDAGGKASMGVRWAFVAVREAVEKQNGKFPIEGWRGIPGWWEVGENGQRKGGEESSSDQ